MPNLKLSNNACLERIRLGFLQVMMSQANIVFLIDVYFAVCLFVCLCVYLLKVSCILSLQDGVGPQEQQSQ